MSAVTGISGYVFEPVSWHAEVRARLEDRHLVAWSDDQALRMRFAVGLQRYLATQPLTGVCVLHGRAISTIGDLCDQLERLIPASRLARTIDGPHGVASLLRSRTSLMGHGMERARIFVWHDADLLVRRDRALFNDVVEVIAGVSAELEYSDEGSVLVQRGVYVGGSRLEEEARRTDSRLNSWTSDGSGIPFWGLVSGLNAPRTALCRVDHLLEDTGR